MKNKLRFKNILTNMLCLMVAFTFLSSCNQQIIFAATAGTPYVQSDNVNLKKISLQVGNNSITVDGNISYMDVAPMITNGRTLVPMRAIVEAIGGEVDWNSSERKITVTVNSKSVKLWLDKTEALVGESSIEIDVPPMIVNDRTLVPVRFISENLGFKVNWYPETAQIELTQLSNTPQNQATLSENVTVIDEDTSENFKEQIEQISTEDNGDINIVLSETSSDSLKNLKPNEVFMIRPSEGFKNGFIGKVSSVQDINGKTNLIVTEPTLEEAFSDVNIEMKKQVGLKDIISTNLAQGVKLVEPWHSPILAAGKGFDFSEIFKNFKATQTRNAEKTNDKNEQNRQNNEGGVCQVYDEIKLAIDKACIYDGDGKAETKDQIFLDGSLTLNNTSVEFEIKGLEELKARVISTPKANLSIGYSLTDTEVGIDDIVKKTQKIGIDKDIISFEGVTEKNKIILGHLGVEVGTFRIVLGSGDAVELQMGASFLLTYTLGGKISADGNIGISTGCFLDKGFKLKKEGNDYKVAELYDTFADDEYPNPNVSLQSPTDEQKKSKPGVELEATISGTIETTAALGVDLGLYICGMCPAKITNDFQYQGTIKGEGVLGTKETKVPMFLNPIQFWQNILRQTSKPQPIQGLKTYF